MLLLVFCTLTICESIDVVCERSYEDQECSVTNLNALDEELNFLTNTKSFRDSKLEISFGKSVLKNVPSEIFTAYKNLKNLSFSNCKITQIEQKSFKEAHNLQELDLSLNKISSLESSTFNGAENLESLDLSFNRIEDIPNELFHKLTKLKILFLSYNKIQTIDESTFSSLTHLNQLKLGNNNIRVISPNLFSQNKKLSVLELNNNQISDVGDSIKNLNKLWFLDLSRNSLTNLNSYPESVKHFYINENHLTKLFINKNVKELNATNNDISEISVNSDNKVVELYLGGNKLENIDEVTKLSNLQVLAIGSNPLKQIAEQFFEKNLLLKGLNILYTDILVDCRHFGTENALKVLFTSNKNLDPQYMTCFKDLIVNYSLKD